MKRDMMVHAAMFVVLVCIGVGMRLMTNQFGLWNFAPVTAIALFAGFYLKSRVLALMTPLYIMLLTNFFLPVYQHVGEMVVVLAALMLPVAFRPILRKWPNFLSIVGCAVGASVAFFLISNFAHWLFYYPSHSAESLLACYSAAIPFFRPELAGNLVGTFALFGSYFLATRLGYLPAVDLPRAEARVRAS